MVRRTVKENRLIEMFSLLAFGALVGMQHALEADHLAAVAALSARRSSRRSLVLRGAWWGIGHTAALFAITGTVVVLGVSIGSRTEAVLELCVGIMVAALGINVLRVIIRRRIHVHAHEHGDGVVHLHVHSHDGEGRAEPKPVHRANPHDHVHPERGLIKALAVGLVHGAAGSGALLVLLVAATNSLETTLAYIACFGLGSILGMAALSFVASFPLTAAARGARWLHNTTMAAIGVFALAIGGNTVVAGWRAIGF